MIETTLTPDGGVLKIDSVAEFVSPLCETLSAICLNASGSETFARDIEFAVVEALNNVILHSYKNQAGNDVFVQWHQDKGGVRIEIIDHGCSMSHLPVAKLPEFNAENGRGWWIINSCVDEYFYKVIEYLERHRTYTAKANNQVSEDIIVKSHSNVLTLIKRFKP